MIISASRRTDIPAFYSQWFINRVQEGYCAVPNPFNRNQVSRISLKPKDVDVIVFWTRNPAPLIPLLDQLDERKLRYYFQYTVLNYPRSIDAQAPTLAASLKTFRKLADRIGPEKVIWRYDPILLSNLTNKSFHVSTFEQIAGALQGSTKRVVVSIVDYYRKARRRWREMQEQGVEVASLGEDIVASLAPLLRRMAALASDHGMEIYSCSEEFDLSPYEIQKGKCVDDELIRSLFKIDVGKSKDPNQRKECGCVISKDIGMYDSCLFGCQYCYATGSFDRARQNHAKHDPLSPSLLGWYEASEPSQESLF